MATSKKHTEECRRTRATLFLAANHDLTIPNMISGHKRSKTCETKKLRQKTGGETVTLQPLQLTDPTYKLRVSKFRGEK